MKRLLFILSLIILVSTSDSLFDMKEPPSEGWSSSISLGTKSDQKNILIKHKEDKVIIYQPIESGIELVVYNKDLKVIHNEIIPIQIEQKQKYFIDEKGVYVLDNNRVILKTTSTQKNILSNINRILADGDTFVAWNENQVYKYEEGNFYLYKESKYPIIKVIISDNGIYALEKVPNTLLDTYQINHGDRKIEFKKAAGTLMNIQVYNDEKALHTIYTIMSKRQGGLRTYKATYLTSNGKNLSVQPGGIAVTKNIVLTKDNETFKIIYSQKGEVFEARLINDTWIPEKRSKTEGLSINPKYLFDDTIFWFEYKPGKLWREDKYEWMVSSSHQPIIEKGKKITSQQVSDSFFLMTEKISLAFIAGNMAFIYLIPPILLILYKVMRDEDWLNNKLFIAIVITTYSLTQWIVMHRFMYKLWDHLWTIPIIIIVSFLLTVFIFNGFRRIESELNKVLVFQLINILIFSVMLGFLKF